MSHFRAVTASCLHGDRRPVGVGDDMNPEDPESAQRIVAEYASVLERESEAGVYPSSVTSLP
jgi:hypothetical protein